MFHLSNNVRDRLPRSSRGVAGNLFSKHAAAGSSRTKFYSAFLTIPAHEPPRSADIPVCGLTGYSCPVVLPRDELATGSRQNPQAGKPALRRGSGAQGAIK